MDIKKIIEGLGFIEAVTPDYSMGRRKGFTDEETEKIVNESINKALEYLEEKEDLNKKAGAIITAYTGYLIGDISEYYKYINEIMDRPIYSHELADKKIMNEIMNKSKKDFINLKVK